MAGESAAGSVQQTTDRASVWLCRYRLPRGISRCDAGNRCAAETDRPGHAGAYAADPRCDTICTAGGFAAGLAGDRGKNAGPQFSSVMGVSGGTILGDGNVVI